MSQEVAGDFLAWDIADRMRKSLRVRSIGVQEMADYLGVGRNTVSTWINGKITPSQQTVRLWAMRTGVPYEWLRDGEVTAPFGPDDGGSVVTREFHTLPNDEVTRRCGGGHNHLASAEREAA